MKILRVLLVVLLVLVCIVALVLLGFRCYMRWSVSDYYKASEKGFVIPDCNNGFVAQGITYDEDGKLFLVTGYQNDGSASPLYLVSKADGSFHKVLLSDDAGKALTVHAGGIALLNSKIYVAGSDENCEFYVFDYETVKNTADGKTVNAVCQVSMKADDDGMGVAFLTVADGNLVVGEFCREGTVYEVTKENHRVETANGGKNHAVALVYPTADTQSGLADTPVFSFSLPDSVQGMCIEDDGKIYLSTSYGLAFSMIYTYDLTKATGTEITVLGTTVPCAVLDETSLVKETKIAPMSEELILVDGKMYIMCESASDKYIFGKLTGGKYCYATEKEFFLGDK